MDIEERTQLCEVCEKINFQAIFTPREDEKGTWKLKALYRPELSGNGESPSMGWGDQDHGYSIRTGPYKDTLPGIRVADYDQLSDSTQSDDDRPQAVSGAPSTAARNTIAAELDGIQDPRDGDQKNVNVDDNDSQPDDADESEEEGKADSISTWSGNSHFTETTRIDPQKEAEGNWGYYHGQLYYLGTIWDLRKRRNECKLCFLFWNQLRNKPHIKTHHLSKSRCVLKLIDLKGRKNDAPNEKVSVLNFMFILGYKLENPREWDWNIHLSFVLQGAQRDTSDLVEASSEDIEEPFDDELFGQARLRYAECDFDLFQKWLYVCETTHDHDGLSSQGEKFIRLIDVKELCLVERRVTALEEVRFCALSYVWGKTPQKMLLTTKNIEDAKIPGFFEQPLNNTIIDAIDVVYSMGEKFLWVDALCILQDSPEDKKVQLPQMHYIYGQAVLTIVAAHGGDSDAGLPGVRPRTRKGTRFRLELDDVRVAFRTSSRVHSARNDIGFKENYLEASEYQNRAWTFQEGYLSTRLLVFTREQVYFECARCTWMEDTHWESDTINFIGWRAFKNTTPVDDWENKFDRNARDINHSFGDGEMTKANTFAALTKEYSYRRLTHESDILNAYLGVLSAISEQEGTDFFFGLRTKHFGNDLLFNTMDAMERRFLNKSPAESGFPTWSWTAWRGPIKIANDAKHNSDDLVENLVPCDGVKCYKLIRTDGITSLQVINESGGWRFAKGYVRKGEGIYNLPSFHRSTRDDRQANPSRQMHEDYGDSGASDVDESSSVTEAVASKKPDAQTGNKKLANRTTEVPEYNQDISLSDLESHPAYPQIIPNFHIMFRTFSSIVVVRSEYDEFSHLVSQMRLGGTHTLRSGGMMSTADPYPRNIYACRKKPATKSAPTGEAASAHQESSSKTSSSSHEGHSNVCPCCGKDETPAPLPENLELGPYLGRLPHYKSSWHPLKYAAEVPDGIYRLLWMNNNQLPMFGHVLCKPVSDSASKDGMWHGEVLQRVCGAVGPTRILRKELQERYCAEWGTFILT